VRPNTRLSFELGTTLLAGLGPSARVLSNSPAERRPVPLSTEPT
jgi:hypothetical protein